MTYIYCIAQTIPHDLCMQWPTFIVLHKQYPMICAGSDLPLLYCRNNTSWSVQAITYLYCIAQTIPNDLCRQWPTFIILQKRYLMICAGSDLPLLYCRNNTQWSVQAMTYLYCIAETISHDLCRQWPTFIVLQKQYLMICAKNTSAWYVPTYLICICIFY